MSHSEQGASVFARIAPKLLISLLLGGLFIWIYRSGGVPLVPSAESFGSVALWSIPTYVVLLAITHLLRASRWRFLIRPVKPIPFKEVLALNWIGFFAIFALPLRIGEVSRPALTKIRHGIPISVGFGTIAVERVVDGLLTSFCVAWALFALPHLEVDDPLVRNLPLYGYATLALFGSAFIALGLFLWKRALAVRLVERFVGALSPRLGVFIAEKVGGVADGIRSLADPRLTTLFLLETLAYWGFNALGMWVLAIGCGLPIGPEHAVAMMGILAIGILLPAGP
ncbi:MAG: flippase-like domain-containing protein, partial [Myxococcales bacterium]|nr:flippase-like domain-containing protein [Myxococcales bacterium]